MHDSYEFGTGSGTLNDKGADIEKDRYGPWMLMAHRKPRKKKTNSTATFGDHVNRGLG